DASWYEGMLWFTLDSACTPTGDTLARSCLRLIQIDTTVPKVVQDFDVGASGYYYFYPSLTTDIARNLDVIFGYSSSTVYPSLAVTGQVFDATANTLDPIYVLKSGSASSQFDRYGDYFSAAIDPMAPKRVWVAGEYQATSGWSTYISTIIRNATISISTDKGAYASGETVSITGTISPAIKGEAVLIQVLNSAGERVRLDQVLTANDGSYSYVFLPGGSSMPRGVYTVSASCLSVSATTSIKFTDINYPTSVTTNRSIIPIPPNATSQTTSLVGTKVQNAILVSDSNDNWDPLLSDSIYFTFVGDSREKPAFKIQVQDSSGIVVLIDKMDKYNGIDPSGQIATGV